jgi:sulfotransferase
MDLERNQNPNKQLFFLVALPRSGNTLFASIINQNPEIVCTPNSITLEIMKDLHHLKMTDVFQNYQDHKSLDNVLDSVYDNYYKDWPQQYIIDRGPVMTPGNFAVMQKHYRRPFKCIVILRDLMDVLASYMKWYKNNPDAFPNRFNLKNDDEKLSMIMNKTGAVAKDLEAIKNAYNYPDMCHFIKYDDLVSNPEQVFNNLYPFLGIKPFKHQFQDLKQIEVNGIGYDDKVVGRNMHTIRNVVRKEPNKYLDQIPERIRQKYGHIRF